MFLYDNIFGLFSKRVFEQRVGILMGINCALLTADLILYSYDADLYRGNKGRIKCFILLFQHKNSIMGIL